MGMVDNFVLFLDADAALTDAVKVSTPTPTPARSRSRRCLAHSHSHFASTLPLLCAYSTAVHSVLYSTLDVC